jgi:hypothetical protein
MIHFSLFLYHILYYARWFCFNGLYKCVTILCEFVFGTLATLAPLQNWTINDCLGPMLRTSHFLATLSQCEYLILECLSHTRVGMSLLSIHIHAWDPPKTCRFLYNQSAQYVHFKRMWILMFISDVQIETTLKQISSWYVEDSYKIRRIIFNVTL